MHFLALTAALLLAPFPIHAFVEFTNSDYSGITAGKPFQVTWQGDGTPVTITLMNGPTNNLATVSKIASTSDFPLMSFAGIDYNAHEASGVESSYTWTPPSDTASGTYALQISQSGYTNYSPQFTISGGSSSSSSSSSSPSSSSPSSTSSSSSSTTTQSSNNLAAATISPLGAAAIQQPPYPAGPGNSSNTTTSAIYVIASKATGTLISAPTTTPGVYPGNGTAMFSGGAVRVGGGTGRGVMITVGLVVVGSLVKGGWF